MVFYGWVMLLQVLVVLWIVVMFVVLLVIVSVMIVVGVNGLWVVIVVVIVVLMLGVVIVGVYCWCDVQDCFVWLQCQSDVLGEECDCIQQWMQQQELLEQELFVVKQVVEVVVLVKGEFLVMMSYEICILFNGILLMLDLIVCGQFGSDQWQMLQIVMVSLQQLLCIVDDIFDYFWLEVNGLDLEIIIFNLCELLDGLVQLMQCVVEFKGLCVLLELDLVVCLLVCGDLVWLWQVLSNLLVNVIKFIECGQIWLCVLWQGEINVQYQLCFEVVDSGIGIDEVLQVCLFQFFSQVDVFIICLYGGIGLGLVICKCIIDLMYGCIGVSLMFGCGVMFWCEIFLFKVLGDLFVVGIIVICVLLVGCDLLQCQWLECVFEYYDICLYVMELVVDVVDVLCVLQCLGIDLIFVWVIVDFDVVCYSVVVLYCEVVYGVCMFFVKLLWLYGQELFGVVLMVQVYVLLCEVVDIVLYVLLCFQVVLVCLVLLLVDVVLVLVMFSELLFGLCVLLVEDNMVNLLVVQ